MQLFEMQGLLAGKCLPGDIKVNESLAEYLLRKLNERDDLRAKNSALQSSQDNIINALGIKGDGPLSKLVIDYVLGLVAERDALAAENGIQDFIITAVKDLVRDSEGVIGWHLNGDVASWDEVLPELSHSVTPATEAAIAEIKASELDDLARSIMEYAPVIESDEYHVYEVIAKDVTDRAANLRAGRKG